MYSLHSSLSHTCLKICGVLCALGYQPAELHNTLFLLEARRADKSSNGSKGVECGGTDWRGRRQWDEESRRRVGFISRRSRVWLVYVRRTVNVADDDTRPIYSRKAWVDGAVTEGRRPTHCRGSTSLHWEQWGVWLPCVMVDTVLGTRPPLSLNPACYLFFN